ncbi:Protein misato 1 [Thoreauomyces humboldtii]|nr:Protein misato 1 [Thoreauomyces humboldtii]
MPKEIITLQLGHTANFVGTHFWNAQDSYFHFGGEAEQELNHDVLYRSGSNVYGDETYTPRLVVCDLKGSLRTLKRVSPLYEAEDGNEEETIASWNGGVEKHVQDPYPKNEFLTNLDKDADPNAPPHSFSSHLDASVSVWSDFNKLYYHPKTLVEVPSYVHDDDQNPFSAFTQGLDVIGNPDFREELLEDRLRFFVEECDSLQGFNVIADAVDGFAGLAAGVLEDLGDEYAKKALITFGVHKPISAEDTDKSRTVAAINSALLMESATRNSTIYVPLYAPNGRNYPEGEWQRYLRKDISSPYRWSGLLSAAIETTLLPVRLKSNPLRLGDLAELVSGGSNRTLASLACGLPFPIHEDRPFSRALETVDGKLDWMVDLTTQEAGDRLGQEFGQCAVVRGVGEASRHQDGKNKMPSRSEVHGALDAFLRGAESNRGQSFAIDKPYPIPSTFPQLFTPDVNPHGLVMEYVAPGPPQETLAVAVMTRLRMSPRIKDVVDRAGKSLERIGVPVQVLYEKGDHGMGREEWGSVRESLVGVAEGYED